MKSYRYAELSFRDHDVALYSTDSQVLDWILAEVEKVVTDYRMSGDQTPLGEKYYLYLYQIRDRGYRVGWWILQQLCLQGWEPFAVNAKEEGGRTYFFYHLRLEGNAK